MGHHDSCKKIIQGGGFLASQVLITGASIHRSFLLLAVASAMKPTYTPISPFYPAPSIDTAI